MLRTVKNEAPKKDAAAGGDDEEGFGPPPARVTTKAGMNRFSWDMRMQAARDFPGLIMWAGRVAGPIVVPGRYQARVTADGQTQTVPLEIRADPRSRATAADLQAQYALARRINGRVNEANEAVLRVRHMKRQIAERAKATEALRAEADALTTLLTDIEGEIYQHRNRSSQDPLNFPIRLNNKLAALQGVVEAGDGAPTAQSVAVFEDLSGSARSPVDAHRRGGGQGGGGVQRRADLEATRSDRDDGPEPRRGGRDGHLDGGPRSGSRERADARAALVTSVTRASRFLISGRVQGVGYRAFVADAARVERLEGWCRNLPDGSVEVLAEGDAEALSRFEWRLWQGPSMARVDDVVSEDVVPEGAHGFRIA